MSEYHPSMNELERNENLPYSLRMIRINNGHRISNNRPRLLTHFLPTYREEDGFPSETVVSTTQTLSKEQISEHLCVMKRNVDGGCEGDEMDICAICLGDYKENEMVGVVECGHQFHVECIKGWLLCNNVFPLCRATALTV
ncbi:E3 ubiquitin-protein ligase MBR2-like [Rutidosis leptorrhynchoides]|uniref:E3 ubiquitin-protein ligase MBR2-like n=1 Tax=Rutidosis leptorrhynchoides TaxID=125765 RepID=UPI003A99BC95